MKIKKILNRLFIADMYAGRSKRVLRKNGIDVIIDLSIGGVVHKGKKNKLPYYRLPLGERGVDQDVIRFADAMRELTDIIAWHTGRGENVAVMSGPTLQTAPSVVAGYILRLFRCTWPAAVKLVHEKMPESFDDGRKVAYAVGLAQWDIDINQRKPSPFIFFADGIKKKTT